MPPPMSNIRTETDERGVARVILHRPEVHNAFNQQVIADLDSAFRRLSEDNNVRVVVLQGEGKHFSAGADIEWMRAQAQASSDDNRRSAQKMAEMFQAVDRCPKPVVIRIQGAALGGGSGLACTGDVVIAQPTSVFGFTEVRLGIVPAVISPFVLRRIGYSHARHLFLTGERFDGNEALRIGLVHRVTDELDSGVEDTVRELLAGPPGAHRTIKTLVREVWAMDPEKTLEYTAETITRARASEEGREGLGAFLEKRKPNWIS